MAVTSPSGRASSLPVGWNVRATPLSGVMTTSVAVSVITRTAAGSRASLVSSEIRIESSRLTRLTGNDVRLPPLGAPPWLPGVGVDSPLELEWASQSALKPASRGN